MTGLTKRLPIALVIKQAKVPAMGNDVIHNRGSSQVPMLLAFRAQRMDSQERCASVRPGPLRIHSVEDRSLALFGPVWPLVNAAGVCARLRIARAARLTARA